MFRRMRRFLLIIFSTLFLADFFSGFSLHLLLARLSAPSLLRESFDAFILLQMAGLFAFMLARGLGHQPGSGIGRPLLALIMIWSLLLALPTAVLGLGWLGIWWLTDALRGSYHLDTPWRTAGLIAASLPIGLALLATLISLWQLGRFRILRMRLQIPHLPSALENFTIAHLSDLHIGKLTRGHVLDTAIAATNQLNADVILLTGDLINMSLQDLPQAFEVLRAMKSKYGLFLCEGNHDLIESRQGFESAVKSSGLNFLLNASATFSVNGQGVQILGLRWGEGMERVDETPDAVAQGKLHELLAGRAPRDFTILLAHHPEAFDQATAAGIPLTLAGHTHGGQLMLTRKIGFGPRLFRYWSGLYRKGSSLMVVSNGTGNWFPLRMGAPAEIIHLTLTRRE